MATTDAEVREAIRLGLMPQFIARSWPATRAKTARGQVTVLRQVIRVARNLRFGEAEHLPNVDATNLDHARYLIRVMGGSR